MKKIIGMVIILFALLISGVYYAREQEWRLKKVVLQENVHADLINEKQLNVKVEELDFKLAEGEYFTPAFYLGEEVYGEIGKGIGMVEAVEASGQFPVGGRIKQYLYQLERDNTLVETGKKVFSHVYLSKTISYEEKEEDRKLYAIDYVKEDEPKEIKELDNILKENGYTGKDIYIFEEIIDRNTVYLKILGYKPDKGWDFCFYDVQKEKLYKRKGDVISQGTPMYIEALKSFLWIDKDLKCYKVVFTEDEYDYLEYLDLKPYTKASSETISKEKNSFIPLNDEEIIIETSVPFREDGYFSFHPIYETKSLSLFNFKTNQFQELFVAKENQHIMVSYSGKTETLGGNLLIIDEFEDDNGFISPRNRFFKTIVEGQLFTIFKEDIRGEGNTLSPFVRVKVREDGKEIFLQKEITVMENDVETSKKAIYKRYSIE